MKFDWFIRNGSDYCIKFSSGRIYKVVPGASSVEFDVLKTEDNGEPVRLYKFNNNVSVYEEVENEIEICENLYKSIKDWI